MAVTFKSSGVARYVAAATLGLVTLLNGATVLFNIKKDVPDPTASPFPSATAKPLKYAGTVEQLVEGPEYWLGDAGRMIIGVEQGSIGVGIAFDVNGDGEPDLLGLYSFEGNPFGCPFVWYEDSDFDLEQNLFERVYWDRNQDCKFENSESIEELQERELKNAP